jgi:hypothetical protein
MIFADWIHQVNTLKASYCARTGRYPTVVYLGEQEEELAWQALVTVDTFTADQAQLLGMRIVFVKEASYCEVGETSQR